MIEIIIVIISTLILLDYLETKIKDEEAFGGLSGMQFVFGISYIICKVTMNISSYWLILYFSPIVLIIACYHLEKKFKTKIEKDEKKIMQYIESQTVYHLNQFIPNESNPIKIIEHYYKHKNFHNCEFIDFSNIENYKIYIKEDSEVYQNLVSYTTGMKKAERIISE